MNKALTRKQWAIMKVIAKGNINVHGDRISWCDKRQILERLPYDTSRDSLMFSLRALANHGLIEKGPRELRDGRIRQPYLPTEKALRIVTGKGGGGGTAASKPSDDYKELVSDTEDVIELLLED